MKPYLNCQVLNLQGNVTQICNDNKFKFCSEINDFFLSFTMAFFGSALIFMSLINFLISLSNTVKIVTSKSVETFLTLERKKEKKLVKAEIIEPVLEEKSLVQELMVKFNIKETVESVQIVSVPVSAKIDPELPTFSTYFNQEEIAVIHVQPIKTTEL